MAKSDNLRNAKTNRNDEFYTQYADIQKEMNAYLERNADVFRNKVILLPCDDPEWSNFTKYFTTHFEEFGIKKLISTSYAPNAKHEKYGIDPQITIWELMSPNYNDQKTHSHGKVFILDRDSTRDLNGDGRIDIDDLKFEYLDGDGDFRSEEVCKLRDEADIIITNPPFSLFREFIAWIGNKKFCIIGSKNAIAYKEFFPLLKDNKVWLGNNSVKTFMQPNQEFKTFGNICWFTNIDHGKRHDPLPTMTMERQIRYSKHKEVKGKEYLHYDNYDAIEVPFVDAIPKDYMGVMGVPITFLDYYCPEQFEILGYSEAGNDMCLKFYKDMHLCQPLNGGDKANSKSARYAPMLPFDPSDTENYYTATNSQYKMKKVYSRVFIRFTNEWIETHPNDFHK